MRNSDLLLLGVLGLLGASHLVAVTTESQSAAQLSWVLIGTLVALGAFFLFESGYLWYRNGDAR